MRASFALLISLTITGALLAPVAVLAAEKTTGSKGKGVQRPKAGGTTVRGDAPVALTYSECVLLGGDISDFSVCKSGKACSRRSENGTMHSVCLTDAK